MSYEEVVAAVKGLERGRTDSSNDFRRRVAGVERLLDWLMTFPGETWQQRWHAANVDHAGKTWTDLVPGTASPSTRRAAVTGATGRLILLDAIRPDYAWLFSAVAAQCPAPGLMETSKTRKDWEHGCTTEVPGRAA